MALNEHYLIIDTHIDTPYRLKKRPQDISGKIRDGNFDYVRAMKGGLGAAFMVVYVPAKYEEKGGARLFADEMIDLIEGWTQKWPDKFILARSPEDLRAQLGQGRLSIVIAMENGSAIEGNLANIEHFYNRGVRYITLVYGKYNHISDSSFDPERKWNGLSPFGREVIAEMNRIGMMIDVSHASDEAFCQILELSKAPVVATHSACRYFTPGRERNMDDRMIRLLADKGGTIQIAFGSSFINRQASLKSAHRKKHILIVRNIIYHDSDHPSHLILPIVSDEQAGVATNTAPAINKISSSKESIQNKDWMKVEIGKDNNDQYDVIMENPNQSYPKHKGKKSWNRHIIDHSTDLTFQHDGETGDIDIVASAGWQNSIPVIWIESRNGGADFVLHDIAVLDHPESMVVEELDVDGDIHIVAGGGKEMESSFSFTKMTARYVDGNRDEIILNLNHCYWKSHITIKWFRPKTVDKRLWQVHEIEPEREQSHHGHARLDLGDINGDGHSDLACSNGWYERPENSGKRWTWHQVSQLFDIYNNLIRDIDKDGDSDLVMSVEHHSKDVYWYEQKRKQDRLKWLTNSNSVVLYCVTA